MQITEKDGVLVVEGDITESMDANSVNIEPGSTVTFDLAGVRTINSCGVREWLAWIADRSITAVYRNCPQSVVMQFNMVSEFLENGARVESFQIPAYCSACDQHKVFTLECGKDFTPGEAIEYEIPSCEKGSCEIDPDVDLDIYCYFVEELEK